MSLVIPCASTELAAQWMLAPSGMCFGTVKAPPVVHIGTPSYVGRWSCVRSFLTTLAQGSDFIVLGVAAGGCEPSRYTCACALLAATRRRTARAA